MQNKTCKCGKVFYKKSNHSVNKWSTMMSCSMSCARKGIKPTSKQLEALRIARERKGRGLGYKRPQWVKDKISVSMLGVNTWSSGIKNPNYIDGKSYERQSKSNRARYNARYQQCRKTALKRDNYTCQECGQKDVSLHVDHIKPWILFPELRYELSNLRTLCVPCHRRTDTYGMKSRRYSVSRLVVV